MKPIHVYMGKVCPVISYRYLFFSLFLLSSSLFKPVSAQFYEPSEKTIRMGESLPESFYQTVHQAVDVKTGEATTLKLDRYRDKLIILDFWATWCGPCLYSLNKLDSIKTAMGTGEFVVIPVTYQNPEEATPAFERFRWDMTSLVSDTILSQIFPHNGIPHQVWIKGDEVIAMPKWDYATAENILKTINDQPVNMVMNIEDRILDPTQPMFVVGNGESRPYYKTKYSKITRYLPGYRKEDLQYMLIEDTTILYANNLSIRELFYQAYKDEIFPCLSWTEIGNMKKGTRWEISDLLNARFFDPPKQSISGNRKQDSIYQEWLKRNRYGYELRYPGKLSKGEAYELMREDLNKLFALYLNITASIKDGPRNKYLVLRLLGSREQAENLLEADGNRVGAHHNKSEYKSYNAYFKPHFLIRLASAKLLPDLTLSRVVNKTGIAADFRVDFVFPTAMDGNFELTQRELARYGLYLTVEDRHVPILVVSEKGARE